MMKIPRFFKKGKARWVLLVILVLVGGFGFWQWRKASQPTEYELVSPQKRDLTKVLEFSGVVNASERVALRFAAGGKLTYVGAKEGDAVKKWQTIATIDARSAQKALQQQLNTYQSERLSFDDDQDDRNQLLLTNTGSRELQKSQLDLNQTVLGVEIQSLAIETTRLSSPIDGILVSSPQVVAGMNLAATDSFEVFNPQSVHFVAYVDEIDVDQVFVGQTAKVRLDAFSGKDVLGKVRKVSYKSAVSASGGSVFPIEIAFDTLPNDQTYRLGMNGEVELILEERSSVLSLPIETIATKDGKTTVSIKTSAKEPEVREVTTGLETDEYIEILSGVSEEDQVILP